jgi:geranylgeranyl pyrophosphate synthase
LRPLLVFLAADEDPPLAPGVAVELVHMATLMHDDLIDGARIRRGRASAWSAYGPDAARAAGDYLFARAFAELSATRNLRAVQVLADTALCLIRGEAMQRRQRHDTSTTVRAYLDRCELKTAKLFEAACVLGGGESLRAFGANLGVAFQIVDDILDCAGETIETGKVAGVDLREGTPTLPLILASREDPVVRRALAGGPQDGALVRVAATGALARCRRLAGDYAARARASLPRASRHHEELDSLVTAVLDRRS